MSATLDAMSATDLFRQIAAGSPLSLLLVDADAHLIEASEAFAAFIDRPVEDLRRRPMRDLVNGGPLMDRGAIAGALSGAGYRELPQGFLRSDGAVLPAVVGLMPLRGPSGTPVAALIIVCAGTAAERNDTSVLARPDLFLAAVSHDVRAPLHGILGAAELLNEEPDAPTARRLDLVAAIDGSARHLLDVITDILDLTRVQSGRMIFDIAPVPVHEVVNDCLSMLHTPAARKAVTLLGPELGRDSVLHTDGRRLKQVLVNLLDNAIKFTPPGGTVRVTARHERNGLELAVIDTGVGIPESMLAQIFDPFSQARNAFIRHYGGTGLGLPVVKALIEGLGGRLAVTTTAGAGSCFTVWLPGDAGTVGQTT